jgi:hypothetical protein
VCFRVGQKWGVRLGVHEEISRSPHLFRQSLVVSREIAEQGTVGYEVELSMSRYLRSPGIQNQLETLKTNPTRESVIPAHIGNVNADEANVDRTCEFSLRSYVYPPRLVKLSYG